MAPVYAATLLILLQVTNSSHSTLNYYPVSCFVVDRAKIQAQLLRRDLTFYDPFIFRQNFNDHKK